MKEVLDMHLVNQTELFKPINWTTLFKSIDLSPMCQWGLQGKLIVFIYYCITGILKAIWIMHGSVENAL